MTDLSKVKTKPPEVPIEVDSNSGVWITDGLPMLYVPRHFFNNLHLAISEQLSLEKYDELLYQSGYKSAYYWCNQQAKELNLSAIDCFNHYLKRLSQRGWGKIRVEDDDFKNGKATIRIDYSSFVLHLKKFPEQLNEQKLKKGACYLFRGWFAGAADWLDHNLNPQSNQQKVTQYQCREIRCAVHSNDKDQSHPSCFFELIKNN